MVNLSDISRSLQSGKAVETSDLIARAMAEHYSVESILTQALIPGMKEVATRYRRKEICQPDLLVAARAVDMGLRILRPAIAAKVEKPRGTVVIGSVRGDVRDIAKNLTEATLEGLGLRVIDLGIGAAPERFVDAAIAEKARAILCTANLPAAMGQLKLVVHAATSSGIRSRVAIIVSGAPVTERYCRSIGADFYARDAAAAAELASKVIRDER